MMLKKRGNFEKDWDLSSTETVVNILTKSDRVENLIDLILDNKEVHNKV